MKGIKNKLIHAYQQLGPFKNIIWFLILFISIDFIWKLCIDEGNHGDLLLIFGKDYTWLVEPVNVWTAKVIYWVVHTLFGYENFMVDGTLVYFQGAFLKFRIIWECTGVKQMIMFAILILLYFGPPKKKIWFIPVAMIVLNLINVIRITAIVFITKEGFPDWFIPFNEWYNGREWDMSQEAYRRFHLDWFELFHKDVFRWLYYNGIMFMLWLFWEEIFNIPYQKLKRNKNKNSLT